MQIDSGHSFTLYSHTATEGEDYGNVSATVVFPVGSRKLDKQCIAVPLIDDCLVEAQESFSMTASILSPSSANIGGDAKSSSRSIEVIVVDNDGKLLLDNNAIFVFYFNIYLL